MKTSVKIVIAVCSVVLVAAIVCGLVFGLGGRKKAQPLGENADDTVLMGYTWEYVLAQAPYTDACVFETPRGLDRYWRQNRFGGSAVEAVLQVSQDGELIVLSEDLPGRSNSDILYGADKRVSDLTLQELKKLNLAYNFEDENGMMTFKATPVEFLNELGIMTLAEFADFFADPQRATAHLYLRFKDEAALADPAKAVEQAYGVLEEKGILEKSTFVPQSNQMQAILDEKIPNQSRTASPNEAAALAKAARKNKAQELPYEIVIVPAENPYTTEQFIHYARNQGVYVIVEGAAAEDVAALYNAGVSGLATGNVAEFIELMNDAESAALEALESTTN